MAGFIGSHLGQALVRAGLAVRGVDAFTKTYAVEQKRHNAALLAGVQGVELVTADLAHIGFGEMSDLLSDVDAVVHLSGEVGVPDSWGIAFPIYVERNVTATQRLLEASAAGGVARFVYASSSSVYAPANCPVVESSPVRPLSPYGVTKLAGECLVGAYAHERGLSTVALRYFSVYGSRQRADMAVHRFIEALLDDRPLTVHGDGRQARDFVYVDDVVAATTGALTADLPPGTVLNVAYGEPVEVRDVIAILAEQLAVEPQVGRLPPRPGEPRRMQGSPAAARKLLGWEAATDLRTGLRRQLDWHVQHRLDQTARAAATPGPAPVPTALPGNGRHTRSAHRENREPRVLFYSQDGLGLGHQRRTTVLAAEFLRACPGASALTVSDSPLGLFFTAGAGHDYCKLPSVRKNGPGDWRPVALASSFPDVLAVRTAMLRSAVESFRPDVVLVDHMPHGAMGELVPTLEVLRDRPTSVVLGLRDILDAPAVVRERWRLEGAYDAVERYYDRVLVYGSPDVFDVAGEYAWPPATVERLRYCGYVCSPRSPDETRCVRDRVLRRTPGARLVVAMAGGGADAYPLFDTLLRAVPAVLRAGPCHLVVVTGPFLPPEPHRKLAECAQDLPVTLLTSVADPANYLAAADLVVAMAGYNTAVEILAVGSRALLVPRSGPSAEQRMRARLFAEHGWVDWLPPEELDPTSLARAITAGLHERPRAAVAPPPDLGGRSAASAALLASLRDTRPPMTLPGRPGPAVDRSLPA
jgi:predicted glycosyltransferase/nucleoside-diphosphate-sugar epimerase